MQVGFSHTYKIHDLSFFVCEFREMTYIPTYIHTYIHTYVHTYIHTCMAVSVLLLHKDLGVDGYHGTVLVLTL